MKEIIVSQNDSGQRLDKFLLKAFPKLSKNAVYKYIRLKRVKINGKRARCEQFLNENDILQLYINDEFLIISKFPEIADKNEKDVQKATVLNIVYEDKNIILLNKPVGILCHQDKSNSKNLAEMLKIYLQNKNEYNPQNDLSFSPALCNRIDCNTQGLVIAAKNAAALREMNKKIRLREVRRFYLCIIQGKITPKEGILKGHYYKDKIINKATVNSKISLENNNKNDYVESRYKTLSSNNTSDSILNEEKHKTYSLLEVEIITGKSHQIRAQLAEKGHPILGDKKYGSTECAKNTGQALYAHKINFSFSDNDGILNYLNNKTFDIKDNFVKT